ncbi:MAG: GNAT family N-acetyltransferase [[Clostridium] aminophilum]|uniref:Ribosomal protein S18 acetylase RimI n=1 Tax=[Clostridium] aminophilum TaxID=1526 RepID=A0A1I0HUR8_9FIRM|nr:GNAT family N-acetyltransferase [[Clostridium] aminophilum]MDD6197289.1 GNAT family N-acetyltransferase [[Clostridium] aminophilum]SET87800.1 Ribosomal protein S18 acetylase RimI [[Clostridium] aminophilum]
MSDTVYSLKTRAEFSASRKELIALEWLCQICHTEDPDMLPWPKEVPECLFFFGSENDEIIAALGLYRLDPDSCEIKMMTSPEHRRRGLFSAMIDELYSHPEYNDTNFFFCVRPDDRITRLAVESLNPEKLADSFRMDLNLPAPQKFMSVPTDYEVPPLFMTVSREEPSQLFYQFALNGPVIVPDAAFCRADLTPQGTGACFFNFEVRPKLRGKHLGETALRMVLRDLASRHVDHLWLHVEEDAEAAVNLYKKTGFRVTETLSMYLF